MIYAMPEHAHDHSHTVLAADALRERGRRLTAQRAVIWEILAGDLDAHLSAEEIAVRVRKRMPQVNPSTVYRNLDVLVEDGLVLRTDLGGDRAYFELAHEHAHHHVVCEGCGRVTHVHDDVLAGVAKRIHQRTGVRVGEREVTFFGVCDHCEPAST
jgi:Fur family ferric uptake transcriptional regulator